MTRRRVVLAYPYYPANPWQRIVYRSAEQSGAGIVPLDSLDDLGSLVDGSAEAVLHLNWLAPIVQRATAIDEAAESARSAAAVIDGFQERGGRVVWTVHNALSHERRFLLPEVAVARHLAEIADAVVIMNPRTPEIVAPYFELPAARTTLIPHPSYLGEYDQSRTPSEAREALGVPVDAPVVALFGALRPYKGLEVALRVLEESRRSGFPLHLLVAGEAGGGYTDDDLRALLSDRPGLHRHVGYVDPMDVQDWFLAADAVLLPYSSALNSGALALAATFGRRIIAPDVAALHVAREEPWAAVYPNGSDAGAIARIVRRVLTDPSRADHEDSARRFAESIRPAAIADRYASVLLE